MSSSKLVLEKPDKHLQRFASIVLSFLVDGRASSGRVRVSGTRRFSRAGRRAVVRDEAQSECASSLEIIYLDDEMRVTRGMKGALVVATRS